MGFKEQVVSKIVENKAKAQPQAPMSNEEWAKICVEAHKMASLFQVHSTIEDKNDKEEKKEAKTETVLNSTFDKFDHMDSPVRLDFSINLGDDIGITDKTDNVKDAVEEEKPQKVRSGSKRKSCTPQIEPSKRRSLPVSSVEKMNTSGSARQLVAPGTRRSLLATSALKPQASAPSAAKPNAEVGQQRLPRDLLSFTMTYTKLLILVLFLYSM